MLIAAHFIFVWIESFEGDMFLIIIEVVLVIIIIIVILCKGGKIGLTVLIVVVEWILPGFLCFVCNVPHLFGVVVIRFRTQMVSLSLGSVAPCKETLTGAEEEA